MLVLVEGKQKLDCIEAVGGQFAARSRHFAAEVWHTERSGTLSELRREPLCLCKARIGKTRGKFHSVFLGMARLGLEPRHGFLAVVEVVELTSEVVAQGYQLLNAVGMMLQFERIEFAETFLYLFKARGIGLQTCVETAQTVGNVSDLDAYRLQTFGKRTEVIGFRIFNILGVGTIATKGKGKSLTSSGSLRQCVGGVVFHSCKRLESRSELILDFTEISEQFTLALKTFLLALGEFHLHKLLVLESYVVHIGLIAADSVACVGVFFQRHTVVAVGMAVFGKQGFVSGKRVNHGHLIGRIGDEKILMLGMYVDKAYRDIAEHGKVHRRVVHESSRTPSRRQLAAQDTFSGIVHINVGIAEERFKPHKTLDIEESLDDRLLVSVADGLHFRTSSKQKRKGTEDNRLSGACLTRDDIESRGKIYIYMLDEGIIGYVETFYHFSAPFFISSRRVCSVG